MTVQPSFSGGLTVTGVEGSSFGRAVRGWVSLLSAAMADPTAAAILGEDETLRKIAFRLDRLTYQERDALAHVPPRDQRDAMLQMAVGVRMVCDVLSLRLGLEGIESPAGLGPLILEARETIEHAGALLQDLSKLGKGKTILEEQELEEVAERTVAAVKRLAQEAEKFFVLDDRGVVQGIVDLTTAAAAKRTLAGVDSIETAAAERYASGTPLPEIADRCLDEWCVLLAALRLRVRRSPSDAAPLGGAAQAILGAILGRYGEKAGEGALRALRHCYERWLATIEASAPEAVAGARAEYDALAARFFAGIQPATPAGESESPPEAAARRPAAMPVLDRAEPRAAIIADRRRRRSRQAALAGLAAVAAIIVYVNIVRPQQNFASLDPRSLERVSSVLAQGYVVKRAEGDLFVGKLRVSEKELASGQLAEVLRRAHLALEARGVTEVLLLDRNEVPMVTSGRRLPRTSRAGGSGVSGGGSIRGRE
ncbi:MAG: hypothetical protein AABZ30_01095 [Myxococcota bacterium]